MPLCAPYLNLTYPPLQNQTNPQHTHPTTQTKPHHIHIQNKQKKNTDHLHLPDQDHLPALRLGLDRRGAGRVPGQLRPTGLCPPLLLCRHFALHRGRGKGLFAGLCVCVYVYVCARVCVLSTWLTGPLTTPHTNSTTHNPPTNKREHTIHNTIQKKTALPGVALGGAAPHDAQGVLRPVGHVFGEFVHVGQLVMGVL